MLICLRVAYGYFQATMVELSGYKRAHGPQSLKYLLSCPLQKKFANTCMVSPGTYKNTDAWALSDTLNQNLQGRELQSYILYILSK